MLTTLEAMRSPRIAIVKLSSLGDVLHALPVLCALKERWPHSRISWLVEPQFQELLQGHEDLCRVIPLPLKDWRRRLKTPAQWGQVRRAVARLRRQLQGYEFDLALDLQGLIKSGVASLAGGARYRLGFHPVACRESLAALFYNRWVRPPRSGHVIEKNLSLLRALGMDSWRVRFKVPLSEAACRWADEWLAERFGGRGGPRPLVLLHPGTRWQSKCWPQEYYVQLIRCLQERPLDLLLSGGPGEEALLAGINGGLRREAPLALGLGLGRLAALLARCDLVLAGDTGPLHLAAALGRPTVSFYGPTLGGPARNGPYGSQHVVFYSPLSCRGCGRRYCEKLRCMRAIEVPQVLAAVLERLGL